MNTRLTKFAFFGALLITVILVTGVVRWPRAPDNLGNAAHTAHAEFLQRWRDGEVVALVRHTERCDRSGNPCSGPADGITDVGAQAATALGKHFQQLGMEQVDVVSSPITRTAQTSRFMFGKDAVAQDWLATCGASLRNDVVAHKRTHHNLLLVTHSGCISDFEAQTGFKHAPTSEYGSALFIGIDASGELQVLGFLNADDWPAVLNK